MVIFKFSKYGDSMGTRLLGAKIRADLRPLLDGEERVALDFSGIDTVTNSFADECIAKLLLEMPLDELKSKTTFTGLTPMTERSILTALKRRHMQLVNELPR
ncbi:MAG: STAS-like domain-containing protein [Bacteroidales bacterium]|nr:STAS-like domain-containing protein [Bacteroidales bacterium]